MKRYGGNSWEMDLPQKIELYELEHKIKEKSGLEIDPNHLYWKILSMNSVLRVSDSEKQKELSYPDKEATLIKIYLIVSPGRTQWRISVVPPPQDHFYFLFRRSYKPNEEVLSKDIYRCMHAILSFVSSKVPLKGLHKRKAQPTIFSKEDL